MAWSAQSRSATTTPNWGHGPSTPREEEVSKIRWLLEEQEQELAGMLHRLIARVVETARDERVHERAHHVADANPDVDFASELAVDEHRLEKTKRRLAGVRAARQELVQVGDVHCTGCGEPMEVGRIAAVPGVRQCVSCANGNEILRAPRRSSEAGAVAL